MRQDAQSSRLMYWLTVGAGLVLAIVPLAQCLRPLRPDLALLFVIYWILTAPRMAGLGTAWFSGLFLDVLRGVVLGQHALGFLIVAFLTHRLQLRMRMFPLLHQAVVVAGLLTIYHFIVFWIDGMIGHGFTGWARWLPVLSGAMLWPLIVAAGDSLTRGSR